MCGDYSECVIVKLSLSSAVHGYEISRGHVDIRIWQKGCTRLRTPFSRHGYLSPTQFMSVMPQVLSSEEESPFMLFRL